jgi:hypothetical protein
MANSMTGNEDFHPTLSSLARQVSSCEREPIDKPASHIEKAEVGRKKREEGGSRCVGGRDRSGNGAVTLAGFEGES